MKTRFKFDELPRSAQDAIEASPFYEGADLNKIRSGFAMVPLRDLVEEVWDTFEDEDGKLSDRYSSFADYHEWYEEVAADGEYGWPPKWAKKKPNSIFAIILDGPLGGPYDAAETTVIVDGWHRFHWYIDQYGPNKLIPVIWSVLR
jgi:hypothetical protein